MRRHGWLAVLVAAVVVVGAAQAASAVKNYHVEIADDVAVAGTTETYTLTLTNSAGSTHTLGSANVVVPTAKGFTVTSPALGATMSATASAGGKQWTVKHASTPSGPVLEYRAVGTHDALAAGEYVAPEIEVATSCDAESATWTTKAKQANSFSGPPGNDFTRDAPDPVLTVTSGGGTPVALQFTVQPTRTQTGAEITPDVKVAAIDACGDIAAASGNVTVAIEDDPSDGAATLGGTTTRALASGVATFDDLTVDVSGEDYTLRATFGSLSVESAAFDVVDLLCDANSPGTTCVVQNGDTKVETPRPTGTGTVALSLGAPKSTASPCGGGGTSPVGSWATVEPKDYTTATMPVTLTYTKEAAPGTGVANFVVCLGKPGTSGIAWTQLLDCSKSPKVAPPCISKRNRTGVGELVITLVIESEDPIGGTWN